MRLFSRDYAYKDLKTFTTESLALQGRDGFNSFQVFVFGEALLLLAMRVC
jgi:hypothetical protein